MVSHPIDPQIAARVQVGELIVMVDPLPDRELLSRMVDMDHALKGQDSADGILGNFSKTVFMKPEKH